jgi:carbonic anhydrase
MSNINRSSRSWYIYIYIYIYTHTCLFLVFVFFLLLTCESCGAENEREFDYAEGGEKGPLHWGEIHEEWAACKNGSMQSPVDMSSERVKLIPKLGKLKRNYRSCNATVINRGHDISVRNCKTALLF